MGWPPPARCIESLSTPPYQPRATRRTSPCKTTHKQYNSWRFPAAKKRFVFKRNQITTDLICPSHDTVMSRNSSRDKWRISVQHIPGGTEHEVVSSRICA